MRKRRRYFDRMFALIGGSRNASRPTANGLGRRLGFESLEGRQMMAALVVNTASDAVIHNGTSLRDAIATASSDAVAGQSDSITFASSLNDQTILLAQGTLELGQGGVGSGTISLDGKSLVTIDGGGASTVFQVDAGVQGALSGLTITNGFAGASGVGGGIENLGALVVNNSILTSNSALNGGGIYNSGSLTFNNSTLSNNSAGTVSTGGLGGGIFNAGLMTVYDSSIFANTAAGSSSGGGGIVNSVSGTMTVGNSTISGNSVTGISSTGGGILDQGALTLSSVTVSANSANGSQNQGGGIENVVGSLTLLCTIVAGNSASTNPDIFSSSASGSFDLIGNGTGLTGISSLSNNNKVGSSSSPINALLGALATNGATTDTMALLTGSPAKDSGGQLTALTNTISSSTISIPVGIASAIASTPGGYVISIDNEQMLVTAVNLATNTLTVTRGYNNTTAAIHNVNAGVIFPTDQRMYPRNGPPDIGAYELTNFLTTGSAVPVGFKPRDIAQAYGFDQVKGDGTGQTIAIIDAYHDPNIASDLHNFDLAMNLQDPPSFKQVAQDGSTNYPMNAPIGLWGTETSMDVEWAHALAPGANILLVEANSTSSFDLENTAAAYAAKQPGVVAVSMSFSVSEVPDEKTNDSVFTTPAGHNGVTFLAAVGENTSLATYPASSPNVVAVGGTTLKLDSSKNYLSETAWSETAGGISSYESQPSYQKGVVTQSTTQRASPDVSFDGDPNTGVAVYDSYDYGPANPWHELGGTSFSTPAWAAIIAIADQGRQTLGLGTLDGRTQTLPDLYKLPSSDFHDVTTGTNVAMSSAGPGYDLPTGLGTPLVNLVVPGLVLGTTTQLPTISGPTSVSASIGQTQTFTGSNTISVTDPNGGNYESVTLALAGNGALSIDTSGGGMQSGTATNLTISGTLAQVNAALLTLNFTGTIAGTVSTLVVTANDGSASSTAFNMSLYVTQALNVPTVTSANAAENSQSSSGLVITPNAADAGNVTNFQITGITNGTLFLNDGVTAITNGQFITVAQGAAGLKFTPGNNVVAPGSFTAQSSLTATNSGLGGSTVNGMISITQAPLAWHNYVQPLDVSNDGMVSPIDALIIINQLNAPTIADQTGKLPTIRPTTGIQSLFDVNGDGYISSLDVLLIIDELNQANGAAKAGVATPAVEAGVSSGPLADSSANLAPMAVVASSPSKPSAVSSTPISVVSSSDNTFGTKANLPHSKWVVSSTGNLESVIDTIARDVANRPGTRMGLPYSKK